MIESRRLSTIPLNNYNTRNRLHQPSEGHFTSHFLAASRSRNHQSGYRASLMSRIRWVVTRERAFALLLINRGISGKNFIGPNIDAYIVETRRNRYE